MKDEPGENKSVEKWSLADGSEWLWQRVIDGVWKGESGEARAVVMAQSTDEGFGARWSAKLLDAEGEGVLDGASLDEIIRAAKWHAAKWASYQQALRWMRRDAGGVL